MVKRTSLDSVSASLNTVSASLSTVLKTVITLSEQVAELPTRNEVEKIVEETVGRTKIVQDILKEIRAMSRAIDKDAVTIVDHERRITNIEHKIILK